MTKKDLISYNISNTNDTSIVSSTRKGLQKLLYYKQANGYNKFKLFE